VIPYLGKYSLVGTTEEEYEGGLDKPTISDAEQDYLIAIVNLYFKNSVSRSDVVGSYSGIRPLIESEGTAATKVSRDYKLQLDEKPSPLMSVYGGKVTTYRVLAEQVMKQLGPFFSRTRGSWTKRATLPGGDFELSENLFQDLASQYSWLRPDIIRRWQHSYGTLAFKILKNTCSMGDMGVCFGANLYQREVDYLCAHEWAHTAEDILWRRTKLGYQFSDKEVESLANYLSQSRDAA
jgi:glycerol-3-phosphate dehydrogenase